MLLPLAAAQSAKASIDVDRTTRAIVWVDAKFTGVVTIPYTNQPARQVSATDVSMCTGWIASPNGHVVTAGHCVRPDESTRRGMLANVIKEQRLVGADGKALDATKLNWTVSIDPSPTVVIGQPAIVRDRLFTTGMTAQLLDSQDPEAGDNALVQVANFDTADAYLRVAQDQPKVLENVTSVGFPGDTARITDVSRTTPTFKPATVSSLITSKKGVPQLQLSGEIIGGMSGGPTLNEAGEVVGVNSSSFTGFTQSYVTDTATMRSFLQRNTVPLSASTATATGAGRVAAPVVEQTTSSSGGVPVWVVVGMAVVLLLVLVAFAYLLLKQRRQRQAAAAAQTTVPDNAR